MAEDEVEPQPVVHSETPTNRLTHNDENQGAGLIWNSAERSFGETTGEGKRRYLQTHR
jgi:hypothetical protein